MTIPWLVAGILSLVFVPIHLFGGEYTLRRVATDAFPQIPNGGPEIARAETRVSWQMGTVIFIIFGLMLLWIGFESRVDGADNMALLAATAFGAWGLLILLMPMLTLHQPRAALNSPQWAGCFLIAILIIAGI